MNRPSPIRRLATRLPRRHRRVFAMLALGAALLAGALLLPGSPFHSLSHSLFQGAHHAVPSPPGSFAGLGRAAEGFTTAKPGLALHFPKDHGAHPDFRTEWWYLTANLRDAHGRPLGVQWTLFRQALSPPAAHQEGAGDATDASATPLNADARATNPWTSNQLWMAHAALSRGEQHRVAERLSRGSPDELAGPAGVRAEPFAAWIDDWQMTSTAPATADALSELSVTARLDDTSGYRLALSADGPLVAHGSAGFSQKAADGQGSFYYSQPFYRVEGEVTLDGTSHRVSGQAWLDREWSSQLLGEAQQGWDWLSLHLDDGSKVMAFRLRGGASGEGEADPEREGHQQGQEGSYLSGSVIAADGTLTPLGPAALSLTPLGERAVAGRRLPTRWRLQVPGQGLDLTITARHPNRWMTTLVPYWEGAVTVEGPDGRPRGEGYLEMTGY
ncbi:lipocalin-like domain-containing protein [Onishia taeanensis]